MIRIKHETKMSPYGGRPKSYITCPQCGKQDWFYSFILRTCSGCGFHWGNVMSLIYDIDTRKLFHREGEII